MRAEDSLKANYGLDLAGGGLSLKSLEDGVSKALGLGSENGPAAGAAKNSDAVSPESVKSYMAGIGGMPLPGLLVQNTVV
jgi:hypothetical protein